MNSVRVKPPPRRPVPGAVGKHRHLSSDRRLVFRRLPPSILFHPLIDGLDSGTFSSHPFNLGVLSPPPFPLSSNHFVPVRHPIGFDFTPFFWIYFNFGFVYIRFSTRAFCSGAPFPSLLFRRTDGPLMTITGVAPRRRRSYRRLPRRAEGGGRGAFASQLV